MIIYNTPSVLSIYYYIKTKKKNVLTSKCDTEEESPARPSASSVDRHVLELFVL